MKCFKLLLPAAVIAAFFTGCEENEDGPLVLDYSKGIYIVNEGTFGSENGSISFYDPEKGIIVNGIFEAANQRPTGDVVQSFAVVNDTAGFIMVNKLDRVEIVALNTFLTLADPIEIIYPRYFTQVSDDKGYVSAGNYQGYLYVIDLNSFSLTDSIKVGNGPENMVINNGLVYVVNSGGWGLDSTISVVDPSRDEVMDTLIVGENPSDLILDGDENLWVYCRGYDDYVSVVTEAQLMKINPVSKIVMWKTNVGIASDYGAVPPKIAVSADGATIYYLRPDGVYRLNTSIPVLENEPVIAGSFYGLEVNPSDGNIFVFESTSFTGNGNMKIFDPNGRQLTEGSLGVAPNGAVFNID